MKPSAEISAVTPVGRETSMQTILAPVARLLRADVLVLLLIFAVFHYFKLSTFLLSIDDEFEALRTSGYNWILAGRWSAYVFLRFLVPQPILPFFPTFLFGICVALSYPLLLSCFGVKRLGPVHYLAFPLYAGFPTWIYLTSFTAASCWAGAAQLVVVVALSRHLKTLDALNSPLPHNRIAITTNAVLCILALAVAIGFYQAFVASFVALGLGMLLVRNHATEMSFRETAKRILHLVILTVAGVALYIAIDAAFRHAYGLQNTHYVGGFLDLHTLIESPVYVAGQTLHSFVSVYAGLADTYTAESLTFPVIILSGLAGIVFWRSSSAGHRLLRIALAAGILCIPFVQHLFNGGRMPLRTLVAIPPIFWMLAMIGLTSRVRAIALTSLLATALGLLQILYVSNLYFAAGHFARIHDQELAAALYTRIVEIRPDYDSQKPHTVDFFGARHFETNYPRPPSSTSGFSFFEWDGGNEERILDYMRLLGYSNLRAPPLEQRRQDLADFKQMPTWPSRDSVRIVGDVTLVKLGPAAGFPFNVP